MCVKRGRNNGEIANVHTLWLNYNRGTPLYKKEKVDPIWNQPSLFKKIIQSLNSTDYRIRRQTSNNTGMTGTPLSNTFNSNGWTKTAPKAGPDTAIFRHSSSTHYFFLGQVTDHLFVQGEFREI